LPTTLTYGGNIAEPNPAPTRTGHTFHGWYNNAAFTGAAITFPITNVTANTTLWARWTPSTYTITYNLDGGTLPTGSWNSYTFGTGLTLPTPIRASHNFGGWFDNAGLTGTAITTISATDTGNRTFWAAWNPIAVTGVTLNLANTFF